MKKINLFTLMLFSMLSFCLISCDDDDDEKDTPLIGVNDAVGTYTKTTVSWSLLKEDNTLETIPDEKKEQLPTTIGTSVKVTKEDNNIKIHLDKEDFLIGTKIGNASNGFTFDIESQEYDEMSIIGYNAATLGDTEYHGVYLSDNKEITIGIQFDLADFIKSHEDLQNYIESDYEGIVMILEIKK